MLLSIVSKISRVFTGLRKTSERVKPSRSGAYPVIGSRINPPSRTDDTSHCQTRIAKDGSANYDTKTRRMSRTRLALFSGSALLLMPFSAANAAELTFAGPANSGFWTVPAGVTEVKLTAIGGGWR